MIWGAGAIGGTIGAYLARAGHDVLFVDTAVEHVARIDGHGLTIMGPIDAFTVPVRAVTPEALEGVFNTLRANVTAFYNEIDDFQSYAFDDSLPSSITANAATAKTKGAELELTWLPSEPAQINVVVAYLDAYYDEYATFTNGANFIDASGNKRELSPEWKYTLAGSYEFDLGSAGTLTPYVQYTYKDDYFITAANNPLGQDHQRSYGQTDIRLIWNSLERHWRGELFLSNIEDNFPKVGAYLATGGYWITYGPEPTMFGAKLAYTF